MHPNYMNSKIKLNAGIMKFGQFIADWLLVFFLFGTVSSAMAGEHHTQIPGETRAGVYIFHNYCSVMVWCPRRGITPRLKLPWN